MRAELKAYGHGLAEKPEIVALNKADALTSEQVEQQITQLRRAARNTPLVISAVSGQGVNELLRALLQIIDRDRGDTSEEPAADAAWQP